ncbi:MAG: NAD(P)H-hydrate dehydratase [Paracoccaceae bacterium]
MSELLTAARMRAIETAAIDSGDVTGLELMERAGRGVVEAIFEEWPEMAKTSHKAVVLCGPGNNGGDGFVVARLLKERGWDVEVFLYGDEAKLPPDAKLNCGRWRQMGGDIRAWDTERVAVSVADLYVDALFGSGLSRAPEERILQPLARLHENGKSVDRLVAVDAPTGLCMDSGRPIASERSAVHGFLTVTFHRARVGHHLAEGPAHCGRLRIADIGLSSTADNDTVRLAQVGKRDAFPAKACAGHKYDHGHALILAGGVGKGGAARLAARGALRIGAGLVTVGCPPGALQENAAQLNAIMVRAVKGPEGLGALLSDTRLNALCLGPGLGRGSNARALVETVLKTGRKTVLDADALTSFADAPETLFAMLHANCVLAPHAGEFARLFPEIAAKLAEPATKGPAYSKVDATREAAKRAGCVVLYKGPDTVIARPDGRCAINSAHYERAAPWLATAGSGDVLAGFIAGLLARGFEPMEAAETAAWLHVECALEFGPGLIAEDLPEQLPAVFRQPGI